MEQTIRCGWPYPSEDEREWFATFVSLVSGVDSAAFASREDRNLVVMSEAVFTFDAATGTVSWDKEIHVVSPRTGFHGIVGIGSLVLPDAQMMVCEVVRGLLTDGQAISVEAVDNVASVGVGGVFDQDSVFVLAIRRDEFGGDERVFFRNGVLLKDGQYRQVFCGGLGDGSARPIRIPLTFNGVVDGGGPGPIAVGQTALAAADYGLGAVWKFYGVGAIGGPTPGLALTAHLYNVTDGETVSSTSVSFNTSSPVKDGGAAVPIGAAAGELRLTERIYEVRVELTGSADPADLGALGSAWLEITYP